MSTRVTRVLTAALAVIGILAGGIIVVAVNQPEKTVAAQVVAEPTLVRPSAEPMSRSLNRSARCFDDDCPPPSVPKPSLTPVPSSAAPKAAQAKPKPVTIPVHASCTSYSGNRATGCTLMLERWPLSQFADCLEPLWTKESGWNHLSMNGGSGAYGIPQSLPGSKMAAFGSDWKTSPVTQIKWGLSYISGRYGTPCNAWAHFLAHNWY